MKKYKSIIITILVFAILIVISAIIHRPVRNKYNDKYVYQLEVYKQLTIPSDDSDGQFYYATLNDYYEYEPDMVNSMYLNFDNLENVYSLLGNIKIISEAKDTQDEAREFYIHFAPNYTAEQIDFRFHGDHLMLDGKEYEIEIEGLNALKAYIDEHTLTPDDVITYVSEDQDAIYDAIREAWNTNTDITATEADILAMLPQEMQDSITIKLYTNYYMFQTTGSGIILDYYPIQGGYFLEYNQTDGNLLFSVDNDIAPVTIDNNPDEVRQFFNDNE